MTVVGASVTGSAISVAASVAADAARQQARPLLNRERKCADTIGTVLVHWAGHFQC